MLSGVRATEPIRRVTSARSSEDLMLRRWHIAADSSLTASQSHHSTPIIGALPVDSVWIIWERLESWSTTRKLSRVGEAHAVRKGCRRVKEQKTYHLSPD